METATAFNKSVKCRKKRKCVVCGAVLMVAVVAMIGADCGTNATSFCHNLCPGPHQPHQQQQPCPGLGYFRTMLAVGPNVGAGPLSVSIVPSAESPLVAWTLASGPQFCSLMAAA